MVDPGFVQAAESSRLCSVGGPNRTGPTEPFVFLFAGFISLSFWFIWLGRVRWPAWGFVDCWLYCTSNMGRACGVTMESAE